MTAKIKTPRDEMFFWFDQARSYYESSKVLDDSEYENKIIPLITLQAFSVECSLKAFQLCFHKEFEAGHNLQKLFNKLPLNIKDDINKKFYDLYKLDFQKCINEIKNDFVESRYFFEQFKQSYVGRAFATGYLDAIADFLLNYPQNNEIFPD
ncbi:HEPN domain-containing protein [Acinetobacter baumannii]|uniref:HEPN domain-containing protein n=1 Tax=Acinetobacter baumannii TaxID=470 RepID=UPI0013B6E31A|nr:HEPN domain-containing protein [Acinetobacter baumannii]NDX20010.1 HEPN domain-containing protein [Acinetobacter baumannii]NDX38419.1 HEPN domain-containing protein [Acinetobacter baumannii]